LGKSKFQYAFANKKLGEEILDDQVLFNIANGNHDKLIDIDRQLIARIIEVSPHLQDETDVSMFLNEIYTSYKLFCQLSINH
jgi:hypothetical protein